MRILETVIPNLHRESTRTNWPVPRFYVLRRMDCGDRRPRDGYFESERLGELSDTI